MKTPLHVGVCPAILAIPAADAGGQHDFPVPSGQLPVFTCEHLLPRPGLHLTAGGGGRCHPAEVPASLPREQHPPLGQYSTLHRADILCLLNSVFIPQRSTGTSSFLKQSARCWPLRGLSLVRGDVWGVTVVGHLVFKLLCGGVK